MNFTATNVLAFGIAGLLLLAFILFAWKDLLMLVIRPSRGMGPGLYRVWAAARTTIIEARAGKAWVLPLLWFVMAIILISVIRPFDESERIPLYVRVLLLSQEWMLLIMIGVLACLSMPRERERKIIITNASKPLSRLEMYLGKIAGFAVTAIMLLVVMGAMSWVILLVSDRNIRIRAAAQYEIAETDYRNAVEERQKSSMEGSTTQPLQKPLIPPAESSKRLSQEGSLFAYNYITVPRDVGFSVAGDVDFSKNPPVRYLKGGSQQKIIYTFPIIVSSPASVYSPAGDRPYFQFQFGRSQYDPKAAPAVQLMVTAKLVKNPLRQQERSVTLINGIAKWEPERPEELFSTVEDMGPVEITVQCPTSGYFLQVLNGENPDQTGGRPLDWTKFNVLAFPDRKPSSPIFTPAAMPQMVGFERRDKQQIAGPDLRERERLGSPPPTELAIYRFRGRDLSGIPIDSKGNFTVAMSLDVDKQAFNERDTEAVVSAYNEDNPEKTSVDVPVRVIEKRVTEVKLPASLLGTDPDPKKRGDLFIFIRCATPSHWIGLSENAVRIELPQSSFFANLIKSEIIIFCEVLLLIVICVTCSVRLGWPVAMLTSALIFLLGLAWPLIAEWSQASGLSIFGYTQPGDSAGFKAADTLVSVSYKLLNLIVSILPDFTRYDSLAYIVELRNIPMIVIITHVLVTMIFTLPFIAAGYMLIRKQELG